MKRICGFSLVEFAVALLVIGIVMVIVVKKLPGTYSDGRDAGYSVNDFVSNYLSRLPDYRGGLPQPLLSPDGRYPWAPADLYEGGRTAESPVGYFPAYSLTVSAVDGDICNVSPVDDRLLRVRFCPGGQARCTDEEAVYVLDHVGVVIFPPEDSYIEGMSYEPPLEATPYENSEPLVNIALSSPHGELHRGPAEGSHYAVVGGVALIMAEELQRMAGCEGMDDYSQLEIPLPDAVQGNAYRTLLENFIPYVNAQYCFEKDTLSGAFELFDGDFSADCTSNEAQWFDSAEFFLSSYFPAGEPIQRFRVYGRTHPGGAVLIHNYVLPLTIR